MDDYYESDESSETVTEDKEASSTFLLNKSVCPGMEPGDTGKFRIEKVLPDEYECTYIEEEPVEDVEEMPEPVSMPDDGMYE